MKFQYASNLLVHRMGGISPLSPAAPILVLAGGVGPLSNIGVQHFYRWCSRYYQRVYTIVNPQDVREKILPNIYTLNGRTYTLPGGFLISGDIYDLDTDILVSDIPRTSPRVQIHSVGVFNFEMGSVRHVSNSLQNARFHPKETLELH